MTSLHSPLGASNAHRWMECPGSVRLCAGIPSQPSNPAAFQGTAAHYVLSMVLDGASEDATDFIGVIYEGTGRDEGMEYEITEDDAEAVDTAVKEVRRFQDMGYTLRVEQRFNLDAIYKGMFGTADIVLERDGHLVVIDYKHGSGKPVAAEENWQLVYYALGVIHEFEANALIGYNKVTVGIIQPRCRLNEAVSYWDFPEGFQEKARKMLAECAKATEAKDAALVTGSHCLWCPAAGVCPAKEKEAAAVLGVEYFDVLTEHPDVETLGDDRLRAIAEAIPCIREWFDAVMTAIQGKLERGESTSEALGYKLVRKRANRKWGDEDQVVATLSGMVDPEALWKRTLVSPAQAEKLVKGKAGKPLREAIESLVVVPEAGVTLAPIWDKREAVEPASVNDQYFDKT